MVEALARYVKELGFCPKGDGELVSDRTCIAGSFIFQTSLFFCLYNLCHLSIVTSPCFYMISLYKW